MVNDMKGCEKQTNKKKPVNMNSTEVKGKNIPD